jgi:hypothetical protein
VASPAGRRPELRPGRLGERQPLHRPRAGGRTCGGSSSAPRWTSPARGRWPRARTSPRPVPLGRATSSSTLGRTCRSGAIVSGKSTTSGSSRPRAESVTSTPATTSRRKGRRPPFPSRGGGDAHGAAGVWEVELDRNLHGWFYWYTIEAVDGSPGKPRLTRTDVLDPYALATVDRGGPGIVLDRDWVGGATPSSGRRLAGPRDRRGPRARPAAKAPVKATAAERRGFTGLRQVGREPRLLPAPPRGQLRRAPARPGIR